MNQQRHGIRRSTALLVLLGLCLGLCILSAGIILISTPDVFNQARNYHSLQAPTSSTLTPAPKTTVMPMPTVAPTVTTPPAPSGWTTVLDDQFTSAGIPAHWDLYDGPYGSGPHNCAAPSQDSAPGDGYLHLTMAYKTSGNCGAGWYTGGMMIADNYKFAQQAVTVRWRIVPSTKPTVVYAHFIIPMIYPDNDLPTYDWYNAEDDLCEGGEINQGCYTFLHDGTASDTSRQVYQQHSVDLTRWHTWRFEQKNGTLTVYLDNLTKPIWVMNQGTSVLPNAMRLVVLQQECPADACPPATHASETEDIQIDWITIQVPS